MIFVIDETFSGPLNNPKSILLHHQPITRLLASGLLGGRPEETTALRAKPFWIHSRRRVAQASGGLRSVTRTNTNTQAAASSDERGCAPPGTEEEEEGPKSKKSFRSQSVVTQNPEAELMLEGDDDAVSLLQEKEIDNLAGKTHTHTCTHAFTHVHTRIHTCTDSAENKTSSTLVFSAIASKTFYLQRQVWQ